MKQLNIPIYRAKRINGDEYVEGYYEHIKGARGYKNDVIKYNIKSGRTILNCNSSIDAATLAIHFPDMLDSEGNKIFASLSEDGKGGDVVKIGAFLEKYQKANVVYKDGRILIQQEEDETYMSNKDIETLEITVSKIKE